MEQPLNRTPLEIAALEYRLALAKAKETARYEDNSWVELANHATRNPYGNFVWGHDQRDKCEKAVGPRQQAQLELSAAISRLLDAAEKSST